jgi:hypothetical protein
VTTGDGDGSDPFDPSIEWDGFPQDTFDDLGSYGDDIPSGPELFFSEYIEGSSFNKAVEIYNGTGVGVDLSAYTLELYSNGSSSPNSTQSLSGTLVAGDVFVVANSQADPAILAETDLTSAVINYNGDDAFVLKNNDIIIDVIGQIGFDPGSSWTSNGVSTQNSTIRRKETVTTGDGDGSDPFDPSIEWDGFPQDTFDDLGSYGDDVSEPTITKIHAVQGNGDSSPIVGDLVTIEGIVVGDFQGPDDESLSGFFVQEEDSDTDADISTSEGIFVFEGDNNSPIVDVSVGDLVKVTGTVSEAFGQTQISGTVIIEIVSSNNSLPIATVLLLPVSSLDEFEALEGMYVHAQGSEAVGKLTVTEFFNFDRFGEVLVGAGGQLGGRFLQYTQINEPDVSGYSAFLENFAKSTVTIDDGRDGQNFIPEVNGSPINNSDPLNTIRGGDQLEFVKGILSFGFSKYRIQPTEAVNYTSVNPRPTEAPSVGGNLKVASFNVLNFFNGDGMGGGFPTARGATTFSDFERQATKIVEALAAIDADIVGLQEIENDGFGSESAIQELVDKLNAKIGPGTYNFVNPGTAQVGTDAITVGMIYKPSKVTEIGTPVFLDDSSLPDGFTAPIFDGVNTNRNPIAQTFQLNTSGAALTVSVNHFKSKGGSGTGLDADQGDGQGNWNKRRTDAANALAAWLSSNPTGKVDENILILGDLNAYGQEDPIEALINQGYENPFSDPLTYSFVFSGQWGSLDYALASPSLAEQLKDAAKWAVNSDEIDAWDYSSRFNDPSLYAPDFYRNSDHDPLIVGFDLRKPFNIKSIQLIDAKRNTTLGEIKDGDVIYRGDYKTLLFSFEAIPGDDKKTESVKFVYDPPIGRTKTKTENVEPYTLFGDNGRGNYFGKILPTGTYTLTATPYSANFARGMKGESKILSFTVKRGSSDSEDTNARKGEDLLADSQINELYLNGMTLYPNPTSGDLNLQVSPDESIYRIQIMDATGRVMLQSNKSKVNRGGGISLNTRELKEGMYIMLVETDLETYQQHFIKK